MSYIRTYAANSTGTTGTLVEVTSDNKLLSANAGTWSMETITDDGATYDVVVLNPILCGYRQALYKLDNTDHIIQGEHSDVVGEITAQIAFSESLKEKLKAYFVANAILGVDPDTLEITEAMLSGKTFYTVSEYGESLFEYEEISFISSTEVEFKNRFDYDGTVSDSSHIFPYTLENGALVIDNSFPEDPSTLVYELESMTDTQWNLFKDRESIVYTHWLLTKPVNFPSL